MIRKSDNSTPAQRGKTIAICAVVAVLLFSMVPALAATPTTSNYSKNLRAEISVSPERPAAGQTVTVVAHVSGGTPPYTYAWTTGDGQNAATQTATFTAPTTGSLTISLTVTDSSSPTAQTATAQKTITVRAAPPLRAEFTFSPARPVVGQTVTFVARASGGTPPLSYSWDFGDQQAAQLAATNPARTTHVYTAPGTYTVTLTVTSAGGTPQMDSAAAAARQVVIHKQITVRAAPTRAAAR